ncbi:MAG: transglycosylase domain-containing protein [Flavobacteriia bacterium]|nr:transglycosylase domain-containing protein [Flavobacteriia bacterium]
MTNKTKIDWRKWLRWAVRGTGIFTGSVLLFVLLVYWGAFGKLPNDDEIRSVRNYLASEVYSEDDALIGKYFVQNRTGANLEELPPYLLNALIATEDVRFREHTGVDYRSLGRVVVKSILLQSSSSGGGSTLTQQLVKNTYGRDDFGPLSLPVAKIKEIILAGRFEDVYTKDQILELYLNTVSFGENVYGIETASQRFFNKKPVDLSLEESAVLVGLLKGNTLYNPRRNPELAESRRNTVLNQMAKYEYISDKEKDSLQAIPLVLNYYNLEYQNSASYYLAHIQPELELILQGVQKPDGSEYDLRTDGLIIETTLDSRLQEYAQAAVARHMNDLQKEFTSHWGSREPWGNNWNVIDSELRKTRPFQRMDKAGVPYDTILARLSVPHPMTVIDLSEEGQRKSVEMSTLDSVKYYQALLHTGFMAMDPATGNVKAWVGGLDYQYLPYDHVTTRRQTASTFKPFVYGAALEQGIDPCEYFKNESQVYTEHDNYNPTNAGGDDSLYYSLKGALTKSLNVVTVQILFEVGMENVYDLARRAGVTSPIRQVPSMALGTNEATLLEMVTAYSTFANHGSRVTPRYIEKITDAQGNVLYTAPAVQKKPAMKRFKADQLTYMLQSVVNEGTGASAKSVYGLQRSYAGKTGTAQNYADGWFIGYSPKLVAGAWVGASNPSVHFRSGAFGSGAHMALPIWSRFFRSIERSGFRNTYTGSFELDSTVAETFDCPNSREANLLERFNNWIEGTPADSTGEQESWWDRMW